MPILTGALEDRSAELLSLQFCRYKNQGMELGKQGCQRAMTMEEKPGVHQQKYLVLARIPQEEIFFSHVLSQPPCKHTTGALDSLRGGPSISTRKSNVHRSR